MPQMTHQSLKRLRRSLSFGLALLLVLSAALLTGCSGDDPEEPVRIADYGRYGANFAERLALEYPYRSPGSAVEKAASQLIIREFSSLGYEPEIDNFSFADQDGNIRYSRNIVIHIPGTGWMDDQGMLEHRQVIIGAHYDTVIDQRFAESQIIPEVEEETEPSESETETEATEAPGLSLDDITPDWQAYDGIHDNAASIGVLMTIARELRDQTLKHDIVLIAFGAGEAGQAGSSHYAASMAADEIAATDVMYNMDSIYAGDKIYAHSGWNTLLGSEEKDYHLRRKLYELTDVFFEHELYTNNGYMLYTNQSIFSVAMPVEATIPEETETSTEETTGETSEEPAETPEDTTEAPSKPLYIYREWTVHESDYRPFDQLNIPIVFFDSGDYQIDSLDDFQESHHPAFSTTEGRVSRTGFDASKLLNQIFSLVAQTEQFSDRQDDEAMTTFVDQLNRRINNTAFLIIQAIDRDVSQTDETS